MMARRGEAVWLAATKCAATQPARPLGPPEGRPAAHGQQNPRAAGRLPMAATTSPPASSRALGGRDLFRGSLRKFSLPLPPANVLYGKKASGLGERPRMARHDPVPFWKTGFGPPAWAGFRSRGLALLKPAGAAHAVAEMVGAGWKRAGGLRSLWAGAGLAA